MFSWRMCNLGRDVEVIDDGMLTTFDGRRINDCCGKWCDAVAFSFCFTVERLEDLLFLQIVGGNLAQEYCSPGGLTILWKLKEVQVSPLLNSEDQFCSTL